MMERITVDKNKEVVGLGGYLLLDLSVSFDQRKRPHPTLWELMFYSVQL